MKQASFSYFILYLRKTPSKRKLPIREKKGATNFSLIRSFDCTIKRSKSKVSGPKIDMCNGLVIHQHGRGGDGS